MSFFKKKSDFENFRLEKTKKAVGPFFVSYWNQNEEKNFKVGLSVKKQKNQIIRNRIRRLIKAVCVKHVEQNAIQIKILFVVSRPLPLQYVNQKLKKDLEGFLLMMTKRAAS